MEYARKNDFFRHSPTRSAPSACQDSIPRPRPSSKKKNCCCCCCYCCIYDRISDSRPAKGTILYSSPSCFRGYFSFCTSCSYSGERIDRSFTLFFLRKTTQKSRFSTQFFFLFLCECFNFSFENLEISWRSTRYRRRNRKFRRYKRERTLPSCAFFNFGSSFFVIFSYSYRGFTENSMRYRPLAQEGVFLESLWDLPSPLWAGQARKLITRRAETMPTSTPG